MKSILELFSNYLIYIEIIDKLDAASLVTMVLLFDEHGLNYLIDWLGVRHWKIISLSPHTLPFYFIKKYNKFIDFDLLRFDFNTREETLEYCIDKIKDKQSK